ncbi:MAG: uracil-DNA glycosylase family protein [Anaerolineales bacterium]|nr:uracil-DNA glycosylase family protein [Anaerolineales bacterium]MCW5854546.1 uracil-DNA glycosylase family protein [Anaerolineales bacterium]
MKAQQAFAQLQGDMRACRVCLQAGYYIEPTAVTQGQLSARMMTIGQAPGVTEVEAKRPFNAGSGKRLFQWLGQAGIDEDWFRRTQYMTSVTKCFPGKAPSGGGDRVPSRAEQELCRPFLERELALVQPELIIPIGRLAIERFFPAKPPLEALIGSQHELDGRWLVPLPHPSGASRWHQIAENRERIEQAIQLIAAHYRRLFPDLAKAA